MKLAEILTGPETWCQGDLFGPAGRMCLIGAVHTLLKAEATSGACARLPMSERRRLEKVIGLQSDGGPQLIGHWNDAPGRTWDEVAAVVDAYDRDRLLNP